tara:strand:- start:10911 stop:11879 length:969 start_codon:yes stop_codon:yes gene_type:complete
MAEIIFQLLHNANGTAAVDDLGGSGLAFYGSTAGSSVQIGEYQSKTFVSNGDGSEYKDETNNIKYVASTYPSGQTTIAGQFGGPNNIGLSGIKSFQGTLGIQFGHTSAVKIQNAQLRVYDRSNINYPASGVNTKVAEIVNHDGSAFNTQGTLGQTSNAVGSGDSLWWGEPWPSEIVTKNYFTNSNGVVFLNGLDTATNTNGDARLSSAAVVGSYDTVGGTGIIVPLSDSPGSGQKQLNKSEVTGATGPIWPKWTQYISSAKQSATYGALNNFGDGSAGGNLGKTYGGTGIDTHHTWSVALSASPLSIGAKDSYGLYVSVEYL